MRNPSRRSFLAGAVLGTAACRRDAGARLALTGEEARTLDAICDQLIPADQDPGAASTGAVVFIDRQLAGPYRRYRRDYREGLARAAALSRKMFGKPLDELAYFVQLAAQDAASNRPEVREAQAQALKVPNTAMAVAMDIGEKKNVHPKNKQNLCDRLARIARANVYGEKIEYLWSDVRFDRRGRPIDPRQVHVCRRRIGRQGRRPQAVPNRRRRQEHRGCCREGRWQYDCGDRPRRPGARRRSLCVASLAGRREPLQRGRLAGAAVPIRRLGVPRTGSCRGRRGRGPGVVRATPPPCIVGISWGAGSSVAQPTVAQPRTVESDRRALPRYAPVIFSVIAKSQGFAGGICTFRPSASCAHCSLP